MTDSDIVKLYLARRETAIDETSAKYGKYLLTVAYNILADRLDSEESVNDTYLAAWNSIPPHEPAVLSAFLSKLTRRISITRLRGATRKKRAAQKYAVSLDEISECVGDCSTERSYDVKLLSEEVNAFLYSLPKDARDAFVCRYYFFDSVKDTAKTLNMTESKLKSLLHRTRAALREHLIKEGFING